MPAAPDYLLALIDWLHFKSSTAPMPGPPCYCLLHACAGPLTAAGHVHAYERTVPMYNYIANPCGTMHLTVGERCAHLRVLEARKPMRPARRVFRWARLCCARPYGTACMLIHGSALPLASSHSHT